MTEGLQERLTRFYQILQGLNEHDPLLYYGYIEDGEFVLKGDVEGDTGIIEEFTRKFNNINPRKKRLVFKEDYKRLLLQHSMWGYSNALENKIRYILVCD